MKREWTEGISSIRKDPSTLVIGLALVLATLWSFWEVQDHEFLLWDDYEYVVENPHLKSGLSIKGILWAFTSTYASYWHPLTWLSLMLDWELYGLNPKGYHLNNLLLHAANALLLFLILNRMTRARWQSAFVAALFAIHPLRVESVAWVTERKDVLSTLFWMLTLWAYLLYTERPGIGRYSVVLLFFTLGLMAKPILVTLPFALLLLDYWPLRRLARPLFRRETVDEPEKTLLAHTKAQRAPRKIRQFQNVISVFSVRSVRDLIFCETVTVDRHAGRPRTLGVILEKVPLLILAAGSGILTIIVCRHIQALPPLEAIPMGTRVANALISYIRYMGDMFWPADLSFFYPFFPDTLALWKVIGSILVLATLSTIAVMLVDRRPYVLVGWLWYLGTFVPVIGIVYVGAQAMADRFTYIPHIGLYLILTWGIADLRVRPPYRKWIMPSAAALILLALSLSTVAEVRHWKDSITLFTRAVQVGGKNYLAHHVLGLALTRKGRLDEASVHFAKTLEVSPTYIPSLFNLAYVANMKGRPDEAIEHYTKALSLKPDDPAIHNNIGNVYAREGRLDEASHHLSQAVALGPENASAHHNLGNVLRKKGLLQDSAKCYEEAIRINPGFKEAQHSLQSVLMELSLQAEAIPEEEVRR